MDDSLAQLVEHNTFNVGVLGSSPKRITRRESCSDVTLFFLCLSGRFCYLQFAKQESSLLIAWKSLNLTEKFP